MSGGKKNTLCFWTRVVGTAIVALSMTMCGGADKAAEDESVEEPTLDQPDVSALTPESTNPTSIMRLASARCFYRWIRINRLFSCRAHWRRDWV